MMNHKNDIKRHFYEEFIAPNELENLVFSKNKQNQYGKGVKTVDFIQFVVGKPMIGAMGGFGIEGDKIYFSLTFTKEALDVNWKIKDVVPKYCFLKKQHVLSRLEKIKFPRTSIHKFDRFLVEGNEIIRANRDR